MKKISLFFSFLMLIAGVAETFAQDMQMPAGAVVRTVNCTITDDRLTFDDVLERARQLDFSENAPIAIQFRRPIYLSAEYVADFQIAAYYSSYSDMFDKRVALGNSSGGQLPIVCDQALVVRNVPVNDGGGLDDTSIMTTRFCNLNEGNTLRSAFNRMLDVTANYERDAENTTAVQIWTQGLGGPVNPPWDFMMALVGTDRQELAQRMDLAREGYRGGRGNGWALGGFTCTRQALWSTNRVYSENN
jgi:hypothetical protein